MSKSLTGVHRSQKRNLREQIVDEIGSKIISRSPEAGDMLPSQDVLVGRYHISRTVLREALNILAGKGVLDARP